MNEFKSLSIEGLKEFNPRYNFGESLYEELSNKELYVALGFNFGIIYNYDSIQFGKVDELEFDIENIIEARFFNESSELVFRINGEEVSGNIVNILSEDDIIKDKSYVYGNKYGFASNKRYGVLNTKKIIKYDDDNAAYIAYIKPCSFEEVR